MLTCWQSAQAVRSVEFCNTQLIYNQAVKSHRAGTKEDWYLSGKKGTRWKWNCACSVSGVLLHLLSLPLLLTFSIKGQHFGKDCHEQHRSQMMKAIHVSPLFLNSQKKRWGELKPNFRIAWWKETSFVSKCCQYRILVVCRTLPAKALSPAAGSEVKHTARPFPSLQRHRLTPLWVQWIQVSMKPPPARTDSLHF